MILPSPTMEASLDSLLHNSRTSSPNFGVHRLKAPRTGVTTFLVRSQAYSLQIARFVFAVADTPHACLASRHISYYSVCKRVDISVSRFFYIAWALLLRSYFPFQEDVSFGYLTSNRDMDLEGADRIGGPLLCPLICRQQLPDSTPMKDSVMAVRNDVVNSMNKCYCDIPRIEAELGLSGKGLFNTMINFR